MVQPFTLEYFKNAADAAARELEGLTGEQMSWCIQRAVVLSDAEFRRADAARDEFEAVPWWRPFRKVRTFERYGEIVDGLSDFAVLLRQARAELCLDGEYE